MGFNYRRRILLNEVVLPICEACKVTCNESDQFCPQCGKKLVFKKTKVFANIGKKGITSYSIVTSDGITINSKGKTTIKLGNGISYTM